MKTGTTLIFLVAFWLSFVFLNAGSAHNQVKLSSKKVETDKEVLKQGQESEGTASKLDQILVSIVFIRHGASTSKFAMLSPDEYSSFGLEDLSFSTLTPLGESQLWSYGKLLRTEFHLQIYSMFNQIEFFIPNSQKSLDSALSIMSGMHNNSPFNPENTEIFSEEFIKLLEIHGVCFQCPAETMFPMLDFESGEFQGSSNMDYLADYLITELDDSLIDPDESCDLLKEMMYSQESMANLNNIAYNLLGENKKDTLEDLDQFIKKLSLSEEAKTDLRFENLFFKLRFLFSEVINKHQYHMLPELEKLPANLQNLVNKETYLELYRAEFFELDYQNDFMANLWVSDLVKKMYGYIEKSLAKEDSPQFNFYTVHNNIMAAILYHFVGRMKFENQFEQFLPQYASSLRFDVSKDQKGTHMVMMKVNGNATVIQGCEKNCTLENFKKLLASYIMDNYEEICQMTLQELDLDEILKGDNEN